MNKIKEAIPQEPKEQTFNLEFSRWSNKINLKNIWFAILLITIGFMLLLNNTGLLPWSIWLNIWRFWPIFLIILGLQFLLGKSWIANLITTFLGLLFVIVIILTSIVLVKPELNERLKDQLPWWNFANYDFNSYEEKTESNTIDSSKYQNINQRILNVDLGGIKLSLNDDYSDDYFHSISKYYSDLQKPELRENLDNGSINIDFKQKGNNFMYNGFSNSANYDISIGRSDLSTDIDVNIGAGEGNITFNALKIRRLSLQNGAGEFKVKLSETSIPLERATIKAGAGSVALQLPKQVGILVDYNVGLGTLKVDNKSNFGKGTFKSSNFDFATKKIVLDINVGAGSIEITTY